MITINEVQASIIARLKINNIPSLLVDVNGVLRDDEIRAHQWQGSKFYYPCIRVKVLTHIPVNTTCSVIKNTASIWVFGENPSALLINDIGSAVLELFHGQPWSDSVGRFSSVSGEQFGADRIEESGVWVTEIKLSMESSRK